METQNNMRNFIQDIIDEDMKMGRYKNVHTRFPPEPNGYLHIGHAKAICIDFGIAKQNNGLCNLRFDDTNPGKEDIEYVNSIQEDIKWLGFDWEDRLYYASSYFDKIFDFAVELIKKNLAFICDLSADEIREYRGTLTQPGRESPYRNRSIEENLELFMKMRDGEFPDGSRVLRAKIDMNSPNLNMRDPVIYRILHISHHTTLDKWCIYPMYDYAHPLCDWIEGISHSICTLEFEDHRPLYDWVLQALNLPEPPRQIEFARLNITHTMMSKRKLLQLVNEKIVSGWDDPRMPTLSGLRRRGYTPESIRNFCDIIGVAKSNSTVDIGLLEHCIRDDLNKKALRIMAALNPVKVIIDNYPEDMIEYFDVENNPENFDAGYRKVPFSKVLYIDGSDFMENPPKKYHRLAPDQEVRLKSAYIIKCNSVNKDDMGNIKEIHCTYDLDSRGGTAKDGRKVRGTIQWVSARFAVSATVRLYDNLFLKEDPYDFEEGGDVLNNLNPDSLVELKECMIEPIANDLSIGNTVQFMRLGYFCKDQDSESNKPIFNRTVTLKDSWAKINKNE